MTDDEHKDSMAVAPPFRGHLPVVMRESARCGWCRHTANFGLHCREYSSRNPDAIYLMPRTREENPDGRCGGFAPSWLTRLVRRGGLRAPTERWAYQEESHET